MTIRARYRMKLIVCLGLVVVGAVTFFIILSSALEPGASHRTGVIAGIGVGLCAAGLAAAGKTAYTLASEERLRKAEIRMKDERGLFIRKQAAVITLIAMAALAYAGSVTLMFMEYTLLAELLLGALFVGIAVYAVAALILKKLY